MVHRIAEPDALQTDTRDPQSTRRIQLVRFVVVLG